jgi:hypothetical protein
MYASSAVASSEASHDRFLKVTTPMAFEYPHLWKALMAVSASHSTMRDSAKEVLALRWHQDAIVSLRMAIADPETLRLDSTLAAALMLRILEVCNIL